MASTTLTAHVRSVAVAAAAHNAAASAAARDAQVLRDNIDPRDAMKAFIFEVKDTASGVKLNINVQAESENDAEKMIIGFRLLFAVCMRTLRCVQGDVCIAMPDDSDRARVRLCARVYAYPSPFIDPSIDPSIHPSI